MMLDEQLHSVGDIVERLSDLGVEVEVNDLDDYSHRDELTVKLELHVPAALDTNGTAAGPVSPAATPTDNDAGVESPADRVEGDSPPDTEGGDGDSDQEPLAIGVTPAKRDVLEALAEHGEQSPSDLEMTSERSSVYYHLGDLADQELVSKRPDLEDARRQLYSLTDTGRALVDDDHDDSSDTTDDSDDSDDDDQEQGDESPEPPGTAADGTATDADANGRGDLTVADIDWLDESSFHVAVAESADLPELRATLGWRDEDGNLAALVRGMDATDDLPDFQEADS